MTMPSMSSFSSIDAFATLNISDFNSSISCQLIASTTALAKLDHELQDYINEGYVLSDEHGFSANLAMLEEFSSDDSLFMLTYDELNQIRSRLEEAKALLSMRKHLLHMQRPALIRSSASLTAAIGDGLIESNGDIRHWKVCWDRLSERNIRLEGPLFFSHDTPAVLKAFEDDNMLPPQHLYKRRAKLYSALIGAEHLLQQVWTLLDAKVNIKM